MATLIKVEELKKFNVINDEIYGQIEALHTLSRMNEDLIEFYLLENGKSEPFVILRLIRYVRRKDTVQYTARLNFSNDNAEVRVIELAKSSRVFKTTIKEALDDVSQYF